MSNETSQETWNATHAQLLKSVADAQAKLLAATNEVSDKLDSVHRGFYLHIEQQCAVFRNQLETVKALLVPPRRPVERLRTKQIVKRPPRKQRR